MRAWLIRLAGVFVPGRGEQEMAEEFQSHLELHIEDNLRAGMTAEEARRQALISLGGLEQAKEGYRDRRGLPFLETLGQDLRFGLRMLAKDRGFTAVAVLTLALGIAANSSTFTLVNSWTSDVLRMIGRRGLVLGAVGVGIGVALAAPLVLLPLGVAPHVPLNVRASVAVIAGVLLWLVALLASYIPARRATRIDPTLALRCE